MTAIVGTINRRGVAFAADSAATHTISSKHKITNHANKIFELSKYHPVGNRGFNPYIASSCYHNEGKSFYEKQNNEVKELHLYNQAQNNQQRIVQKSGSCCDCCFDCLDCMCDCCEGCINCMCDCSCDCSEEDCGKICLYLFCCICYVLLAGLGN